MSPTWSRGLPVRFTFAPVVLPLDEKERSVCPIPHEAGNSCVRCHNRHVVTCPPLTGLTAGMTKEARASQWSQSEQQNGEPAQPVMKGLADSEIDPQRSRSSAMGA